MRTNLNGIILNGKVYVSDLQDIQFCHECDLYETCMGFNSDMHSGLLVMCQSFGKDNIFLYSQSLTKKLNKQ